MEQVGVEAIVKELAKFTGDIKKVDSLISSLVPGGNLLSNMFQGVGSVVEWLTGSVFRVLEYTLGNLIASAIQTVISSISEFINTTIEAANELARLEVRLTSLNLPESVSEIDDWTTAMETASEAAGVQLDWLQQLSIAAPFPPNQIVDIYTAARTMGYADEEARALTTDILEFSAAMGLTSTEAERIIVNLRQMGTRGKVTGREMADLARGALVPLDDVLIRMADNMGISVDELNKLIATGEGIDPKLFVTAFQEMVNEEPKFIGAMGRLGRTFEFSTKNFKEFIGNIGAKNIVMPVMDILGERIASITDQFVYFNEAGDLIKTEKWDMAFNAAERVGTAISNIVTDLLGLAPTSSVIADGIVGALDGMASWLEENNDVIVGWVEDAVSWIQDELIPAIISAKDWLFGTDTSSGFIERVATWIQEKLIPAFDRVSQWLDDNSGKFEEFFSALGDIGSGVLSNLFGGMEGGNTDFLGGLLDGIIAFVDFVVKNKDAIAGWITVLIQLGVVLSIVAAVVSKVIGFIIWLASVMATIKIIGVLIVSAFTAIVTSNIFWAIIGLIDTVIAAVISLGSAFIAIVGTITAPVWLLIGLIALLAYMWVTNAETIKTTWSQLMFVVSYYVGEIVGRVTTAWTQLWSIIQYYAGQWWNKISTTWSQLLTVISFYATSIWNTIKQKFTDIYNAISSISWFSIGASMMQGMMSGILSMATSLANAAVRVVQSAVSAASSALGIRSPSKVFFDIGENVGLGMAQGIAESGDIVKSAMQGVALGAVGVGASASMTMYSKMAPAMSSSVNNTKNYNLSINSSSPTEPIISDFYMLESLG